MESKKGRLWTPEDDEKARAMYDAGMTTEEIGRELGRTAKGVADRLRQLRMTGINSILSELAGCKPVSDHYQLLGLTRGMKARPGHAPGWKELI